jgi:tRNA pseudouridine55 synthase
MNPTGQPIPRPPDRAPRPPPQPDPDGLLLVDKPAGWTSHDVVGFLRGQFRLRKVGHGGTLDPMATGLLVILIGRATKLSGRIMGSDKVYEGAMRLGASTETHDVDGRVVQEADPSAVTRAQLEAEMKKWTGDVMQLPPMVSAIKKDGVPLYKLARKGQEVERTPRMLHVYEFQLLDFAPPTARFRLRCTKGTYVRTLCHDIGQALGCGAHLNSLRRLQSGRLKVDDAVPVESLRGRPREELVRRLLPLYTTDPDALL